MPLKPRSHRHFRRRDIVAHNVARSGNAPRAWRGYGARLPHEQDVNGTSKARPIGGVGDRLGLRDDDAVLRRARSRRADRDDPPRPRHTSDVAPPHRVFPVAPRLPTPNPPSLPTTLTSLSPPY